ncbi:MAG: HAD family hydrolase [Candidatus Nephrothrix sp. EaCA]|nr:MAG: HAD family hydrolase [Candidatus Nephrothrix sp. EaCA]
MQSVSTIVFDLGGVLIDWNPSYVFHDHYFESKEKERFFFSEVCTADWNERQDSGYPVGKATQELVLQFPEWEKEIRDYYGLWANMLGGPITETVNVLKHLKSLNKYKIYSLTNWNDATFQIALARYDFLHWFDGIVVSGEEKCAKPHPEIYKRLIRRYQFNPVHAVFIDDRLSNVEGAAKFDFKTIHFQNAEQMKTELKKNGVEV